MIHHLFGCSSNSPNLICTHTHTVKLPTTVMPGGWSNGLFGCLGDCGACCKVIFCPCCAAGEIYEGAGIGSCFVGCLLFSFLGPCYPCLFTAPVRNKYNINGSCPYVHILSYTIRIFAHSTKQYLFFRSDTCLMCFCGCCQMTRELREVRGN